MTTSEISTSAISINLGQIEVKRTGAVLICPSLGSCLGLVALDRQANVSGAAIIMLPQSAGTTDSPGRYANLAVKDLIAKMAAEGASQERIRIAIAGGAQVFRGAMKPGDPLDIGGRNVQAVLEQLGTLELTCVGQETGGDLARTLVLDSASGRVTVKTACGGEKLLCNLGE